MKIETLPTSLEEFKRIIDGVLSEANSRIRYLEDQIRLMNARSFAQKSEKYIDPKVQPNLFDEIESTVKEAAEEEKKTTVAVSGHVRQKRKGFRRPLPDSLPVITVTHDSPPRKEDLAEDEVAVCIKEDRSERLGFRAQEYFKEIHITKVYIIQKKKTGESRIFPYMAEPQLLPKSMATPSLLADLVVRKFCDGLPFYRQSKIMERYGIYLPRQTICRWMQELHEVMKVIEDKLRETIKQGKIMGLDETTVRILSEDGIRGSYLGYMWVAWGGPPGKNVRLFWYNRKRNSEFVRKFTEGYHGSVVTDGYEAYVKGLRGTDIIHAGCWAHVRRGFMDTLKAAKDGKSPAAQKALGFIQKLYEIESRAREQNMNSEQMLSMRKAESVPVLEEMKSWLDGTVASVPPKSHLGKAIRYALDDWSRLMEYTKNGDIPIDNNRTENTIRPFVVGRKGWLFSGHTEGAEASAFFYSLIETAKANGLEPYWYLYWLFEHYVFCRENDDYERLMPYVVTMDKIKDYFTRQNIKVTARPPLL